MPESDGGFQSPGTHCRPCHKYRRRSCVFVRGTRYSAWRIGEMNLYLLRHAKACDRSKKWTPDSKRPLTPEGEEKMYDVARGIKKLDLSFDVILASPYARALRTAQIAAEVLKLK